MNIHAVARATLRGVALVAVALVALLHAIGGDATEVRRIGVLADSSGPQWDTFARTLRELGHVEGQTILLDWRWAHGQPERFPGLAAEVVRRRIDVIVTEGSSAARAAKSATTTIPIVMAIAADPVRTGLVSNLARPDGNITGSSSLSLEVYPKQLELLKEVVPKLGRVAVLADTGNPTYAVASDSIRRAADALGLQLVLVEAPRADALESAMESLVQHRVDALLVIASPIFDSADGRIASLAAKADLPAIYNKRSFAEAGGMLTYGASYSDFFRRAAIYVDKILKGAKPGDLPVEQPTKFELVINLKTAKALRLSIPQALLVRADEVIQ